MKKRAGDILKLILFLGIGIFFIYWFLLKLDAEQKRAVWTSFVGADYWWVAFAMVCCLASHLLRAMRWRLLYRPLSLSPGLNNTFGSVVVGYMANLAFPRLGEVMRCATMRTSEDIPIEKSLGTVFVERMVDVLLFALVVLLGLMLMYSDIKDWLYNGLIEKYESLPSVPLLAGVAAALLLVAYIAYRLFWKRLLRHALFRKIDDLVRGCIDGVVSIFHLGWRRTLLFIAYSVGIYMLYILCGLIIMEAFDATSSLGFKAAFAIYLFGSVGMIFSQGGLGVYPVMVQMALALYALPMEVGTAAGWLLWGSQQVVVIIVGLVYLVCFSQMKQKKI